MNSKIRNRPDLVVALFTILFLSPSAFANEIKIKFCDTCRSDSQFARAGETSALTTHPLLAEGAQQILGIDADSESMRMIVVTREAIDPTAGPGGGIWSTTSAIADLDPALQAQALDGVRAVQAFMAETRNEHAGDLDFGVVPMDSAADLPGTGDVPDFVRDTFAQALNNRLTDGWVHQITWDALSFANRVANHFMGTRASSGVFTVLFEDGTSIDAALTKVLEDEDGDISFELAVNPPYSPPFRREGPSGPVTAAFRDRAKRRRRGPDGAAAGRVVNKTG